MKVYQVLFWTTLITSTLMWSCQSNDQLPQEKSVEEILAEPSFRNSDIIRSPVSATRPDDTINVAKIKFTEETYDFGSVQEGDIVTHEFNFTNVGKQALLISNARSTCGCTIPDWPKDPIAPGAQGKITVRFDTKNKSQLQVKPVTITANTYPATSKVYIQGTVETNKNNSIQ